MLKVRKKRRRRRRNENLRKAAETFLMHFGFFLEGFCKVHLNVQPNKKKKKKIL